MAGEFLLFGIKSSKIPAVQAAFSYYEYKYLVPHESLSTIKPILEELYGRSDPYRKGIVDSIYYDTLAEACLDQCRDGEAKKVKFRIRGYDCGHYSQIHQKSKDLFAVSKLKARIKQVDLYRGFAPNWDDLRPFCVADSSFQSIRYNSEQSGPLIPSIRVRYQRYRFRSFDFRMTLDTNIRVAALANGIPRHQSAATLPYHVLELKTAGTRPKLPFAGLVKLRQVSFSKFMLGIHMLDNR